MFSDRRLCDGLVQRIAAECGVSECDLETSKMRKPWAPQRCWVIKRKRWMTHGEKFRCHCGARRCCGYWLVETSAASVRQNAALTLPTANVDEKKEINNNKKRKEKKKERKDVGAKNLRQQIRSSKWRGNKTNKIKHGSRNKKEQRK